MSSSIKEDEIIFFCPVDTEMYSSIFSWSFSFGESETPSHKLSINVQNPNHPPSVHDSVLAISDVIN